MNEIKKKIYYIQGMHCKSCELLIEENVLKVPGVQKAEVNHRRGVAEVYYLSGRPTQGEMEKAVRDAGYTLGRADQTRPLISRNPLDYIELFFATVILLLIFILLKIFGVFDLNYAFGSSPRLLIVGLIGLTAGISTCMALVGGIVLAISARHSESHPEATPAQKFRPHIFFNVGRIVSYVLLGGFVGLIGSSFRISNTLLGILIAVVGIVMFFLGLKLIEIFPRLSGGFTLPKGLSRIFGISQEKKEYSHKNAFVSGALTFFLPCGLTQAMQLYAMSTGSFIQGGLIMGIFALGTMPGLIGIGSITSFVKGWFARYFFKFAGLVVIALGILNISNGYNLTGITLAQNNGVPAKTQLDSRVKNGVQIVEMTQAIGYSPNHLTIKKDIPVKWLVNSTNPYSCSSYLVVPGLGISKALQAGANVIEFMPTKVGTIKFTCGMGMYSGYFNVIN